MSLSTIHLELTAVSIRCKPKEFDVARGKVAVNQVFELLKGQSRYPIDRVCIIGSAGTKTAIASSDFECVIFINDLDTSKEGQNTILQEFKTHLPQISTLTDLSEIQSPSTPGLHFTINDFDVDLRIAPNFVSRSYSTSDLPAKQAVALYDMHAFRFTHTPAHCESLVRFMSEQSAFIHDLVRLCKFWDQRIVMPGTIKGRSTLIELIAVKAGEESQHCKKDLMYYGFSQFLTFMKMFSRMRVSFVFDATKGRGRSIDGPHSDPPYVLDPANPEIILAENVNDGQRQIFENKATESLHKLHDVQHCGLPVNSLLT